MTGVRILVVEDEPLIADDIANQLRINDFEISAIAYDYEDAVYELKFNAPDAVVLDINLGAGKTGVDIAEVINEKYGLPFIFLTSYADKETLERAKRTEPLGYVVKPFDERNLIATLEIALYNFSQKQKNTQPALNLDKINARILSPLTEREFAVLQQIYEGKSNQQMADSLFVSINTIKTQINSIYLKMEANSRSSLLAKLRGFS
ncbi:response regulator transcription factor [Emticicia sp. W12TSBA100-4]|uniref:response regulator transcription factor n=1 Tax=Emticicia sp. W12TSBA100-4 TaxID=3160965 RepID=UPI0033061F20